MKKITEVLVSVEFKHNSETISKSTVSIEIEPDQAIEVRQLVDACQRSVGYCIDELKKDLDST